MDHQKGSIPARNDLSDWTSSDLKKQGLKYMGSATVYSHLQACGIINDHWEGCFRYQELIAYAKCGVETPGAGEVTGTTGLAEQEGAEALHQGWLRPLSNQ